ncbi:MAG: hypothetical protein QG650_729 [Patescibacteria group bacterium]|nr:hypothetical protein [Patescibacteria group bacterium]
MKTIAILCLVAVSVGFFRYANENARPVHKAIELRLVEHPEFIPQANDVRLVSSGFDNLLADFYWLSAIQYVGANALSAEYKRYLYEMLNLVTDLNPAFTTPYEVGLLLLPDINPQVEHFTKTEQDKNVLKAVWLGEKGIKTSCDAEKIKNILAEPELAKVWTDPAYRNPCKNSMIPYYLAYVEYYNLKHADKASDYYRIAAAGEDAPTGARIMSAIMKGKSGGREKSILMFLSIAESLDAKNGKADLCRQFSGEMRDILVRAFASDDQGEIPSQFIRQVEEARKNATAGLDEKVEAGNMDAMCTTYLGKAVRELNLEYITRKDRAFVAKTDKQVDDAKQLYELGGIDYLPKDFQKLDGDLEIIYFKEDGVWDYAGGKY